MTERALLSDFFDGRRPHAKDTPVRIFASISEAMAQQIARVGHDTGLTQSATIRLVLERGLEAMADPS